MTELTFHPPTTDRVQHIADNLREADIIELAITSPDDPVRQILADSVRSSRWAIAAEVDGVPAILYGVAPSEHDPNVGVPWMLATDDLLKVRREFLARCRREVRLMQQRYLVLANEVHRDNAVAIRWLEWLGFTVDRSRPTGPGGALYAFWKGPVRHV
jgi:hypothetical protein